jgi:hypothetical protein
MLTPEQISGAALYYTNQQNVGNKTFRTQRRAVKGLLAQSICSGAAGAGGTQAASA